jgi:hypothetical protein
MANQSQEFWQRQVKTSPYLLIGIVFCFFTLLWQPALPYLYFGALAGFVHLATTLTFHRKAHVFGGGLYFFFYPVFKGLAKHFYPTPDNSFLTGFILPLMFCAINLGALGLLQIIFRRAIVARVGLNRAGNTTSEHQIAC